MIDFASQTYANILAAMLDQVPNTIDKREGSMIQTALGPPALALSDAYQSLNMVQLQAFVQTASGQSLDYIAIIASVSRYPASAAVRLGVFNIDIPLGSRFSTIDGDNSINLVATEKVSTGQYQMTAETPGTIGNSYVGPILPITPISGLDSAQITDILVPGDDTETDDEFRARIIEALNNKPFGGNIADYRTKVLAIDGVGAVQVWPTWNGGGTVKLSILGADFNPASPTLVENVQNAVDPPPNQGLGLGTAPIGAQVTVVAPTEVEINVTATIMLASGVELAQVQEPVETAISNYLLSVRQSWGNMLATDHVEYAADVYVSRVIAAMLTVDGVVNVQNLQLNGGTSDIMLTESGTVQQVPTMGTVSLSV